MIAARSTHSIGYERRGGRGCPDGSYHAICMCYTPYQSPIALNCIVQRLDRRTASRLFVCYAADSLNDRFTVWRLSVYICSHQNPVSGVAVCYMQVQVV